MTVRRKNSPFLPSSIPIDLYIKYAESKDTRKEEKRRRMDKDSAIVVIYTTIVLTRVSSRR